MASHIEAISPSCRIPTGGCDPAPGAFGSQLRRAQPLHCAPVHKALPKASASYSPYPPSTSSAFSGSIFISVSSAIDASCTLCTYLCYKCSVYAYARDVSLYICTFSYSLIFGMVTLRHTRTASASSFTLYPARAWNTSKSPCHKNSPVSQRPSM